MSSGSDANALKVLVAGATGLIGAALVRALIEGGARVHVLVRDTERAAERLPAGVTLFPWNAVAGPPPAAAFDGVGAVVNLVGESISDGRWTAARRKQLHDSRIVATRALVNEMRGLGTKPDGRRPPVLVAASAVGYYGDRGDEILTEVSACGSGFLAELARDWEGESMRAAELGSRVVIVRNGAVLARQGGFLRKVLPVFRLGLGGRVGSGAQWFPWIHLDDTIALIRHAISEEKVSGVVNGVAPEPVTNRELTAALGEVLSRPTMLAAPAFALRLALGAMADELLLASQRVMPVRTLENGFTFRHPLLRGALKTLLD
jgi:uncharacterized protein (TIGR01777 family)